MEVIEELIKPAKEINAAATGRPDRGGVRLSSGACENESAARDGTRCCAHWREELTDKPRKSATINWQKPQVVVRGCWPWSRCCWPAQYLPDAQPDATDKVIAQAELLADTWAFEHP